VTSMPHRAFRDIEADVKMQMQYRALEKALCKINMRQRSQKKRYNLVGIKYETDVISIIHLYAHDSLRRYQ
jgi:hypothetical protein